MNKMWRKVVRFINNPWVVAAVLIALVALYLDKVRATLRAKVLSNVSERTFNQIYDEVNSSKFSAAGAGVAFLVDGLGGLSNYLFGSGDRLKNYLTDKIDG